MTKIGAIVAFVSVLTSGWSPDPALAADGTVELQEDERTTVHVGDLVTIRIASDRRRPEDNRVVRYEVQSFKTTGGGTLVGIRRSRRIASYRAVKPGQDTIILSPASKPGEC